MSAKPRISGSGHGEQLSRKAESFCVALLACASVQQAAASVGVAESTGHRWLKDAGFQELYRQARRDALNAATSRLQASAGIAVTALVEVAAHGERDSDRVAAARTILESSLKTFELHDLAERIQQLETTR
jgi:hypothetical protein